MLCFCYANHILVTSTATMFLGPSGPADLYHLTGRFLVTPQHWPASPVSLDKSHLELGPKDPELALFRFDRRE